MDSDGNVHDMIPWLKEAGIDGVFPLERQAGVDVNRLRAQHPDLLMLGAYDKLVMNRGEAAMIDEFERIWPAVRAGGFLPSVDHQTPPEVSFDDYRNYLTIFKRYACRP